MSHQVTFNPVGLEASSDALTCFHIDRLDVVVAPERIDPLVSLIINEVKVRSFLSLITCTVSDVLCVVSISADVDGLVDWADERHTFFDLFRRLNIETREISHMLIFHVRIAPSHREAPVENISCSPPFTVICFIGIRTMVSFGAPRIAQFYHTHPIFFLCILDGVSMSVSDTNIILVSIAARALL